MLLLFGSMILLGLGIACLAMLLFWILWLKFKKGTLLEVGRALAVVLICGLFLWMGNGWKARREVFFIMIFLWGIRLALFLLFTRVLRRSEQGRYQRLMESWKTQQNRSFLYLFQVQATAIAIFTIPALLVSWNKVEEFSALEMEGFIFWCLAFFGEAIADSQLSRFRSKSSNAGKTCREGLWKYSRHPNYFFEWLVWCAIALFALASPLGWWALVCPALMYYFLTQVTGIPVTEALALRHRGETYRNYQRSTSPFFLRPKR